jgi:hypothetical protein
MKLSLLFSVLLPAVSSAFVIQSSPTPATTRPETQLYDGDGTGGWGIGGSREITPEEFLGGGGERAYFEGYNMRERGDFMRSIKDDNDMLRRDELDELLGVAKSAGLNVRDPSSRLNKFEGGLFDDDDDDELDLSV